MTELKIVYKKTSDLIPYARNNKIHQENQIKKIASSIKEFGFKNPVIITKDNSIIAGHGRTLAAEKLGLNEIPCIIADDLTEAQIKAYRIADNKLAELSEWNSEMLALELDELGKMEFDFKTMGFEIDEVEELSNLIEGDLEDSEIIEDDAPVVQENNYSKLGDLWLLGEHRLLCGDSTDEETVERLMAGEKAEMVFTDPPYGVEYEGVKNDDREGLKALLEGAFKNYEKTTKLGGAIYCFHSDRCADIFHLVFRKFFHFSSMIIWNKNSLTLSQTDYQSKHEPCLYGWVKGGTHKWYSDRKQTSVWDIEKERFEGHTTPKPVEIVKKAIINSSKKGELVIDLFGGSGSTLIGAEQTGRKAFLMELDEKYVDVIVKRYHNLEGKTDIKLIRDGKTYKWEEVKNELGY